MFPVILFMVSGVLGTILALRLMALDDRTTLPKLTIRGRIVIACLLGLMLALIVVLINGMWWDCDLRPNSATSCRVFWGY